MRASEYIFEKINLHGLAVAQVDVETRRSVTFHEILKRSKSLAGWLKKRGFGKGSTIGLMSKNCLDFACILLGVWESGAACYLIDPRYTSREVIYALDNTPVDLLFLQKGRLETLDRSVTRKVKFVFEFGGQRQGDAVSPHKILEAAGRETFPELGYQYSRDGQPNEESTSRHPVKLSKVPGDSLEDDSTALIISSSGTTGLPKGVIHTHASIVAGLKLSLSNPLVGKNDQVLGTMPLHHIYGLLIMLNSLCQGATLNIVSQFSFQSWIETIKAFSITRLHLVPSLLMSLLKSKSIDFQDLASVKHLYTAAAPVTHHHLQKLREKFLQPVSIHKLYGLSESFHHLFANNFDAERPESLGRVVKSLHAKIVDVQSRKALGPNSVGELCIKGATITRGYINNPEATAQAFEADGWLRTGDLGYFDEDNYFFLVDRLKSIIKYQGNQVSSSELEFILTDHPNIVEAAVIGIDHDIFGQVPRAYLVLKENSTTAPQEIHDYLRAVLAPFKLLRGGLVLTSSLPKTSTGKMKRHALLSLKEQNVYYDSKIKKLITARL